MFKVIFENGVCTNWKAWKIGILKHSAEVWRILLVTAQENSLGNAAEIDGSILWLYIKSGSLDVLIMLWHF